MLSSSTFQLDSRILAALQEQVQQSNRPELYKNRHSRVPILMTAKSLKLLLMTILAPDHFIDFIINIFISLGERHGSSLTYKIYSTISQ